MNSGRCLLLALACLAAAACDGPATDEAGRGPGIDELLAAGRLAEAERQIKSELRRNPEDPALRLSLGRIYLARGDGAAAFTAFVRARDAGAGGTEVLGGLAESLVLQERYAEALGQLASRDAGSLPPDLLRLRLRARLRVPLANPGELFGDARALLAGDPDSSALERLAGETGVIAANAVHVRRALAYGSCRPLEAPAATAGLMAPPEWADLDEAGRRVLEVGPEGDFATPSAAASAARDGDIVEIAAGAYPGDVATWNANGLWIRAAGGPVVLDSGGKVAEDMGIWVIRGDDTVVEGIRFTGARSTRLNGSGIRMLGHNLWVRRSEFHDNENGILASKQPGSATLVEHSVFTENGAGDGYSHNIYVGRTSRLTFRFNVSTGARIGHQLKSRAFENYILYNRLWDAADGTSSYTIDLAEGGFALIVGNEIQQGPQTVNKHMVSLGAEALGDREHRFIVAYNTFYNHTSPATFIRDATGAGVALLNNVFAGAPANIDAAISLRAGNAFAASGGLVDPGAGDFGLAPAAAFIDEGDPLETVDGVSVVPRFEYAHPAGGRPRAPVWQPDPGAHEFCGWPKYPDARP